MVAFSGLWSGIQNWLFPDLEKTLGEGLSPKQQEFDQKN